MYGTNTLLVVLAILELLVYESGYYYVNVDVLTVCTAVCVICIYQLRG